MISRIDSDIFLNTPFEMLDALETPFGNVFVKINSDNVSFRCRKIDQNKDHHIGEVSFIIDIDTTDLKVGDIIECGFEDNKMEYNDSDERSVLHTCENEKIILGLCGFDPVYHDVEHRYYCYSLVGSNDDLGFV